MENKILVLISGGIDSFVLLNLLKKNNFSPICVFIDYGQLSAKREYKSFKNICRYESIRNIQKIEVKNFGKHINSGLIKKTIKNDYFPARNLLLISLISPFLEKYKCNHISLGIINSTRYFSDCSQDFFMSLSDTLSSILNKKITIITPIYNFTKVDIFRYAEKYELPISLSYSCQKGTNSHCKKCPSCIERLSAIKTLLNEKNGNRNYEKKINNDTE
ncbi:7-cyano-7-deazaguanine synthase [Candidatus Lokiarchaeum ossiferum]|uniref:7-cyano-7-deazaguanine synthase n=1 Tax=Candidatus Lokiarchaeum ossiferum TaxID=2951803 RepID=UPI00352EBE7D